MIRYSIDGKRTAPGRARRRMPASAVAVAVGVAVASLWLVASAEDGSAARGAPLATAAPPATAAPAVVARLADISSHDGLYRATMVLPPGPIGRDRPLASTLEVRTARGAPVEGAALALESWMPDDTTVVAPRPRATAELGGGRYRIEGLRFDREGWWNVRLRISGAAGTDSLAFNLVLR
jgi:hypothetical protein